MPTINGIKYPLYIYVFIQPQNYNTFFTYEQFNAFFSKNSPKILSIQKKMPTFASQFRNKGV